MSKPLTASLLAAGLVTMAAACWIVSGAIPLAAASQTVSDAPGVTVDTGGAELLHRGGVAYPPEVQAKGIEGTVVVQATIDANGEVSDANVLSGPDELRRTVLQSVLSWHFTGVSANSKRQVSVTFGLPTAQTAPSAPAGGVFRVGGGLRGGIAPAAGSHIIESIRISGLSEEARAELLARLPVKVGDDFTEAAPNIFATVHEFDRHLTATLMPTQSGNAQLNIAVSEAAGVEAVATGPTKIRVGGNVQATNLITPVRPVYPPAAKEQRIQGAVKLEATIGPDGKVEDLRVVSGHPLLVQAALDAVKDWVYRPTLLNGNPVTVVTSIDVNFTLSQ
jgi:TonB family protein